MKKNYYVLTLCLLFATTNLLAQRETITFTGQNANTAQYVQLTKVVVTNQTAQWSDTIVYPDTTVVLSIGTGIAEQKSEDGFGLDPNRPNPFNGYTEATLQVAAAGALTMDLFDINGHCVSSLVLPSIYTGRHQFRVSVASSGIYILTARQNGRTSSVKMIAHEAEGTNSIVYAGHLSSELVSSANCLKKAIAKPFHYNDVMLFTGFAVIGGQEVASKPVIRESVVTETITLPFVVEDAEFVCGQSCAVDIDGNIYHTVQLGEQCWMTENMRATRFSSGIEIPLQDIESSRTEAYRYLPGGEESHVAIFGYLYNWPAAMSLRSASNTVPSGIQGVCPDGWHLPSAEEYRLLYNYMLTVDDYVCEASDDPERPALAKALSSNDFWRFHSNPCSPGGDSEVGNATGFNTVPAGFFFNGANGVETSAYLWTTTEQPDTWQDDAFNQFYSYGLPFIQNTSAWKDAGYSVRCLRN